MDWLKKRRRGFAVAAGVAGVTYCGVQYARSRLEAWQAAVAERQAAQDDLKRRFSQLQENGNLTTLALLPTLLHQLCSRFDVDALTSQLHSQRQGSSCSLSSSKTSEDLSASQQSTAAGDAQGPEQSVNLGDSQHSHVLVEQTASMHQQQQQPEQAPSVGNQGPARSKSDLWGDIKILSFCRAFTAIYAVALVGSLTQVQLAILGRYGYLASMQHQAQAEQQQSSLDSISRMLFGQVLDTNSPLPPVEADMEAIDAETELHFLALSWWILHKGWARLADQVQAAVNIVFSGLDLKSTLSPKDFQTAILKVRYLVEGGVGSASQSFVEVLLPSTLEEEMELQRAAETPPSAHTSRLQALRDELADVFDGPDFQLVLKSACDALFAQFTQSLDSCFTTPPHAENSKVTELPEKQTRLVKLLPKASREAVLVLTSNPNEYVDTLGTVQELRALSAVLLSSYDQHDPSRSAPGASQEATPIGQVQSYEDDEEDAIQDLTDEQKQQLAVSIGELDLDALDGLLAIVRHSRPELFGKEAETQEVELDIDAVDRATLYKMHRYIVKTGKQPRQRQGRS